MRAYACANVDARECETEYSARAESARAMRESARPQPSRGGGASWRTSVRERERARARESERESLSGTATSVKGVQGIAQ
jgi:hypothetical protein